MSDHSQRGLTPEQALDRLEVLHTAASDALRAALERFVRAGVPPIPEERERFRYPELRLVWHPLGQIPFTRRAWAKFQVPGVYVTTITQPAFFRHYLLEQLQPLVAEYGATIEVSVSDQEVPYPYVLEPESEIMAGAASPADLARHLPTPMLSTVGDEVADGLWVFGDERPLALFDAVRVDYSLRRLVHYTGTDWRAIQPWILLTNYQRYVDQFVQLGLAELAKPDSPYGQLIMPGGGIIRHGDDPAGAT